MKLMGLKSGVVGVACAMVVLSSAAQAAIINVPGDQPTIQAGINVAGGGDEIVVAPGTYFETINFFGKAITLRSSDVIGPWTIEAAPASATFIAGGGSSATS